MKKESFLDFLKEKNYPFGFVSVELDKPSLKPNTSTSRKVFYFLRPARRPQAPYIVFFNGGPGMAASEMFLNFNYEIFLPDYNVVFFDQRGNGLSFGPSETLEELQYFSAKQIAWDAELIRREVLGDDSRWIVFGQSYGGIILRKYLEQFPESVLIAISHGSGIYDGTAVAIETEKGLITRWDGFFKKYPSTLEILSELSNSLSDAHEIIGTAYSLKGKSLIHLLAIYYTVLSDEDMEKLLNSLDKQSMAKSYIEKISPIAQLVLAAGNLNRVIAYMDLLNGKTDEEMTAETIPLIVKSDWYKTGYPSKIELENSVVPISKSFFELEELLRLRKFKPDGPDMEKVSKNISKFGFNLHIFGSEEDVLAIDSVKKEEEVVSKLANSRIKYHYSKGHHREWLSNPELFKNILP